jgi:U3 small nucleolar RNA-associated protein 23
MKPKDQRNIRKIIRFYRMNFNFFEPLTVILDGSYLKDCLEKEIKYKFKIKKMLRYDIHFKITYCLVNEIKYLS